MNERDNIRARYERRSELVDRRRYSPLKADVTYAVQERQRATLRFISRYLAGPLDQKSVLEVGCGDGDNLLELIQWGFNPELLAGVDLLPERIDAARRRLPSAVRLSVGDASEIDEAGGAFDLVLQYTVFTSILDDLFQRKLADTMWALTKAGGAILWYDFMVDNPRNPDVRGIPLKKVKALFPKAWIRARRVTLAPPLARRAARVHPALYPSLNVFPFLRTHWLCWIGKK